MFSKKYLLSLLNLGWFLFLRDFQGRYRQTYLGYFWALSRPLLSAAPIILVGKHFKLGGEGVAVPYELFAFTGVVLLQSFWDAVVFPQWITRRARKILKNFCLPPGAILIASSCYIALNLLVYISLITLVLVIIKPHISLSAIFTFLSLPLIISAGLSIGIFFIPITLVYLDIRYSLPLLYGFLLWTLPLFYKSPEYGLLSVINKFNPLTYLILAPRDWLFGEASTYWPFTVAVLFFLTLLIAGLRFNSKALPIAVDQVK